MIALENHHASHAVYFQTFLIHSSADVLNAFGAKGYRNGEDTIFRFGWLLSLQRGNSEQKVS